MARQLKAFDFAHPGETYPWAQWLNCKPWLLIQGDDFQCSRLDMKSNAHVAAKRRGLKMRTQMQGKDGIVIEAYREGR